MEDPKSFDALSKLALNKLLKVASDKKKAKELESVREATEACLKSFSDTNQEPAANGAASAQNGDDTVDASDQRAAEIFLPFKLAFDTKNPRVVEEAMEGLHELIAHGYLKGNCPFPSQPNRKVVDAMVEGVCACGCINDEQVQMHIIRILQTAVVSEPSYVHGSSLLHSVRTCLTIHLGSSIPANQTAAKAALTRIINVMMKRMEGDGAEGADRAEGDVVRAVQAPSSPGAGASSSEGPPSTPPANGGGEGEGEAGEEGDFARIEERDVYEVLYRLCKLSMKFDVVDSWVKPDEAMNLQSKVLSLELLLSMLEKAGPTFRTSPKFIACVKQHLCLSLLKNGVSSAPKVFHASVQVFVQLILQFKMHLKHEIGVFFTTIFLKILESANSTLQQKLMVLQLLHKICKDSQIVLDIYINYDCDLEYTDIFAKMLNQLTKIVQSGSGMPHLSADEELQMRQKGTDALTAMIDSLYEFTKRVERNVAFLDSGVVMPKKMGVVEGEASGGTEEAAQAVEKDVESGVLKQKEFKTQLQQALKLFATKPKKGIGLLVSIGHIDKSPAAIAKLFHEGSGVDKKAMGDYMGEPDEHNKAVLYAYVDSMSFAGMSIDNALRHFLAGFWLPGEAQKIDRMMEKFAERFCKDTNAFSNADTAYVLAYSIIMLNTDAHSPKVMKKMTKDEFKRNNRGINDGADLPPELLEGIYDRITASGFKVKDDDESDASPAASSADLDKTSSQAKYRAEAQHLMTTAQGLLKRATANKDKAGFLQASKSDHLLPMLEVGWAPLLAALSLLLEESQDPDLVSKGLQAMEQAITLYAVFGLTVQRDAFVATLAQFTNLHCHAVREMKPKNIEAIRVTLNVARTVGNLLGASWGPVLRCISQLDRLQLIGSGAKGGGGLGGEGGGLGKSDSGHEGTSSLLIEEANSLKIEEVDTDVIDRVFSSSAKLSDEAIVDFVSHLCAISREEIQGNPSNPRVFSMQKIVEITYFNMQRIRIVWSRIWSILGEHFQSVALIPNIELSMYAIDSMRQLALKFLEKDELTSFHFQRDFLKPFDFAMGNSKNQDIRELVIRCLTQVVLSTARNIKSGWKVAFQVLNTAGRDAAETIVLLAFDLVRKVVHESFHQLIEDPAHGSAAYVDCINCLTTFASNAQFPSVSLEAVDLIHTCTSITIHGLATDDADAAAASAPGENGAEAGAEAGGYRFTESEAHVRLWFPVLTGLNRISVDPRLDIRTRALDSLFQVLETYGETFSPGLWDLVFPGVLFPLFDDIRHVDEEQGETEWLRTSCAPAMTRMNALFAKFFSALSGLLPGYLRLLGQCIAHHNEAVAHIGVGSIKTLLAEKAAVFSDGMWDSLCEVVASVFEQASPLSDTALAEATEGMGVEERLRMVGTRHRVRMLLLKLVQDLCADHGPSLGQTQMNKLLNLLGNAHNNALGCSLQRATGQGLEGLGELGAGQYLQWIYAESAEASRSELSFMFSVLHRVEGAAEGGGEVENRLHERVVEVLVKFSGLSVQDQRSEPGAGALVQEPPTSPAQAQAEGAQREHIRYLLAPAVLAILEGLMALPQPVFERLLSRLYALLCSLIECNDPRVRVLLTSLFLHKIGPALRIPPQAPRSPTAEAQRSAATS